MFFRRTFPFIENFINELSIILKEEKKESLSKIQINWLTFCLSFILITGKICWTSFEKFSLGKYKLSALSWMFHYSKIPWSHIIFYGIKVILKKYNVTKGHLVIDDTDRARSKSTTNIGFVHKIFDKKTAGYFRGQNIVFLLLVTDKITIPVWFKFYKPDPKKLEWVKKDEELKKLGVPKSQRPIAPKRDSNYPTKIEIAIQLVKEFNEEFSTIKISSISADAFFGTKEFFKETKRMYPYTQVISQLRSNHTVLYKNNEISVSEAFKLIPCYENIISIRGGKNTKVKMSSFSMTVISHNKKYIIIALKYENEEDFRYILASDSSWTSMEIIKAYSLRWLIEVFFSDWKRYDGWGQTAFQQGDDGACRGVILSVLADLCLLNHPDQISRIENQKSACTVGSRQESLKNEALLDCFEGILHAPDQLAEFEKFKSLISIFFKPRDSIKHLNRKKIDDIPDTTLYIKRKRDRMKTKCS